METGYRAYTGELSTHYTIQPIPYTTGTISYTHPLTGDHWLYADGDAVGYAVHDSNWGISDGQPYGYTKIFFTSKTARFNVYTDYGTFEAYDYRYDGHHMYGLSMGGGSDGYISNLDITPAESTDLDFGLEEAMFIAAYGEEVGGFADREIEVPVLWNSKYKEEPYETSLTLTVRRIV